MYCGIAILEPGSRTTFPLCLIALYNYLNKKYNNELHTSIHIKMLHSCSLLFKL